MLSLKRRLYQFILRLHPAAFRNRFAHEMSLDFEDALATYGFPRLLLDATGSLGRQWGAAPIAFTRTAPAGPAPLHPLLAGQYVVLEGDPLTPLELLRGALLFAAMLLALVFMLNHGGNYVHSGHLPGLPANQTNTVQRAHEGPFQPTPGERSQIAVPIHPDPNLLVHPETTPYFVRTQRQGRGGNPQPETWFMLLLRCAFITGIVWITSLMVRRSRGIGARIAYVGLAAIAVLAAAAYIPAPAPPAHAQVLPGRFSIVDAPPAMLPPPDRNLSFAAATIRATHLAAAAAATSAADGLQGAPATENGFTFRTTLPIRSLIASLSGMPSGSESRVVGGPAWLDSETYTIQAKIDSAELAALRQMSPGQQQYQIQLMEQSLLVSRFHLKAHTETRPLTSSQTPVDVLVIDHIDRPSEN